LASWNQFEAEAPELAAVAERLWPGVLALARGRSVPAGQPWFAVALLATVRADGGPRLHPFCPLVAGGRLFAAIPTASPKGRDLRRDPRCVVHAVPGPDDDELCIRAVATEVTHEESTRAEIGTAVKRSNVDGMVRSVASHPLFELDLVQVDTAVWLDIGEEGTRAVRRRWRAR